MHKEALLRLVDSVGDAAAYLVHLRGRGFDDGLREVRWQASLDATWQERARTMQEALADRLPYRRRATREQSMRGAQMYSAV